MIQKINGIDIQDLCKWKPNPQGVTDVLNRPDNPYPDFTSATYDLQQRYFDPRGDIKQETVLLYEPLLWCNPDYERGAQAIGSCVAWGGELAQTLLIAKWCYKNRSKGKFVEAATEAAYGLCRVEALGRQRGGWSDGAYGAAMAQAAKDYGAVLRLDHSLVTGNPEHDLRIYDGRKEKNWGNFGCGGQNDKGKLDEISRLHPVQTISQVHSFEDCATAIGVSLCPVTIASDYGCSMRRDADGFCGWTTNWPHQMVLIGVRFGSRPGCLCAQSWGPYTCSGPKWPRSMPDNIAGFTWWIDADVVTQICRSGDCWALGDIQGWRRDRTNFKKIVYKHTKRRVSPRSTLSV